jgi:isopenicillin N synthase-like dioxygenase
MATATMTSQAQAPPPFPDDVPTAPLLRISFEKLLQRNDAELERFNRACEDLGFFYLDLTGPGDALLRDADKLFDIGEELFNLPLEEKMKYDFSEKKSYFGYKAQGAAVIDKKGNVDRNEFYNVCNSIYHNPGISTDKYRSPKTTYSASQTRGQRPPS